MSRFGLLALTPLVLAGCIFGGKEDKSDNSTTNNVTTNNVTTNNVTTNNVTTNNDAGTPDDMGAQETYLTLDAQETSCSNPRTAWFSPPASVTAKITADSAVVSGAAPREGNLFNVQPIGQISVAHATPIAGRVHVYAAAGDIAADGRVTAIHGAETAITVDADVYAISITAGWINRTVEAPVGELFSLLLTTSRGIYDCAATLDIQDRMDLTCVPSPLNDALSAAGIDRPAQVDAAPIFEFVDSDYGFNVAGSSYIAAVSGPTPTGEQLGFVKIEPMSGPRSVQLPQLENALDSPEIFGERTAFGVEGSSFGLPLLLTLARERGGEVLAPRVLRSLDRAATEYALADVGAWDLSELVSPQRGMFTFVDGYDVTMAAWFELVPFKAGFTFAPGQLSLGYVGVAADASGLVFSRPGGFAGGDFDFVRFDLADAEEVAAFKNIPVDAASSGSPAIAVIHGEARDKLAVFNWGFGTDAKWVENLLGADFTNAQRMASVWFFSDQGTIPMLAERSGVPVMAIVPVNLAALDTNCR